MDLGLVSHGFEIIERDPTFGYVRYNDIVGEGPFETIYKAFDEVNGLEVAWCKVAISDEIFDSYDQLSKLHSEANLLKSLNHENVIRYYHSWVDYENRTFNLIIELLISGNLRQYCKKYGVLDNKVIKNFARQILRGLHYLHNHDPPIVHKDLKCENIYVNGNSGQVKIGDLELATVLQYATARRVIGTPEFMAPELCEEGYNHLVDIYSFGMCMLEMVTRELPYSECKNSAQVYKKVAVGIKPNALDKVFDPEMKLFIEKCLAPVSERLAAIDLLNDQFLALGDSSPVSRTLPDPLEGVKVTVTDMNVFKLKGRMKDRDSIAMTLWIADLEGNAEKVEFVFFLETDTIFAVTQEMAKELELSTDDTALIAELMDNLITEIAPDSVCTLEEAKYFTRISSLSEDDLSLNNVPTRESYSREQDTRELSSSRSVYAGLSSNKDKDSCANDEITANQEEKQARNGTSSQHKHFDSILDKASKRERKWFKKATHKAFSSRLRKLISSCRNC